MTETSKITGKDIVPLYESGQVHLNGIQATAYCRIRQTAGDDYRRTERQRLVIQRSLEYFLAGASPFILISLFPKRNTHIFPLYPRIFFHLFTDFLHLFRHLILSIPKQTKFANPTSCGFAY